MRKNRVNNEIIAAQVRLIDESGENKGILLLRDAISTAKDRGLDLVEISPMASPIVCKIIDYGKYRFDQEKEERKKKANRPIIKEVKLTPRIEENDFDVKLKQIDSFLEKHYKVQVSLSFKGREINFPEKGLAIVNRIAENFKTKANIEGPYKDGKSIGLMITCK